MLEIIKQKYNIIRQIGRGGMAHIYLASERGRDQKFAIKVIEPSSRNDIIKQKRFEHEIQVLKCINSPYVAKIHDAQMNDNYAFMVMEYVDGFILRDYIVKYSRLTVDMVVDFTMQLTLGFDEIHNNNVIHRDIKSQNIIVGRNGRVKIIDFGIALSEDSERLTKTNMLIGSPHYVSPELIDQEVPTFQADIYALGVLMYEMLVGDVPFKGKDSLAVLKKHQSLSIPRVSKASPNVPQSVENIIIKATAKNKKQRYNTMYDFYLDLKTCLHKNRLNEKLFVLDQIKPKRSLIELVNSKGMTWIIVSLFVVLLIAITILVTISLTGDL